MNSEPKVGNLSHFIFRLEMSPSDLGIEPLTLAS